MPCCSPRSLGPMCCVLGWCLESTTVTILVCVLRNIWRDVSERVAGAAAASHGSLVSATWMACDQSKYVRTYVCEKIDGFVRMLLLARFVISIRLRAGTLPTCRGSWMLGTRFAKTLTNARCQTTFRTETNKLETHLIAVPGFGSSAIGEFINFEFSQSFDGAPNLSYRPFLFSHHFIHKMNFGSRKEFRLKIVGDENRPH